MMIIFAKLFGLEIADISDCPFTPDSVGGRPVLIIWKNFAILG